VLSFPIQGRAYVDTNAIIGELEAEPDRLTAAIEALSASRRGKRATMLSLALAV
jgi:hypothetical protein